MYTIVLLCLGVQTCSRITEAPILLFKQPVHGFQIQILVCIFPIILFLTRTLAMFSQCSHMTLSYAFNHFLTYSRFFPISYEYVPITSHTYYPIMIRTCLVFPPHFPTCSSVFPIFSLFSLDFSSNSPNFSIDSPLFAQLPSVFQGCCLET